MNKNLAQEKAVNHFKGPMMLLAGPGSGKTTTMTRRVERLLETYHVNPAAILVVTFTKAAAREMKQRFENLCVRAGVKADYRQVTFGTFHGIFYGILRHAYGLTGNNILSEEKKLDILKELAYSQKLEIQDE